MTEEKNLLAAVPDDLAEAKKVLEQLKMIHEWKVGNKAADLIITLLARIAAQEARIEAMDAQYVEILGHAKAQKDRAEAAETALAAITEVGE